MNRFEYTDPSLTPNEAFLAKDKNVRLYDGDQKTSFEGGEIVITTHRIFWGKPGAYFNGQICMAIPLNLVTKISEETSSAFSFSRSRKVVLYLNEPNPDRNEGPQLISSHNHIKLSFREGFSIDILAILNDCLYKKRWLQDQIEKSSSTNIPSNSKKPPKIELRTGIVGIERKIQEKQKETDKTISEAFQDLDKLMEMAKDMVTLSKNISMKIREKQGEITEDETIQFKSYLLSLGIEDPVTRDAYKSDKSYYRSLANEINDIMLGPITDAGGMMALSDVYCRVNRARGLELLSPEDLLNACKLMDSTELPIQLHVFESGVKVLRLKTLDNESVAESTADMIDDNGALSAEELAQLLGISVMLAKERLLATERLGKACRDDSIEGLRFYPNWFLEQE